ncbi:MAG: XTP/dITP diphosphatase [Clostridia bacterium]|nr:XTP/dITP diphosphatase [Clostridia bacterium]MDD4049076.1 XTP/dITP diphosphatase [Clostridia bacterium]
MSFKLVVATRNKGKIKEIGKMLKDVNIEVLSLEDFSNIPEIEETGTTFLENALSKARVVSEVTNCLTLADDSGLEVDALRGQPGVYSARFAGEHSDDDKNNFKLLKLMDGVPFEKRTARFVSVIAIMTPEGKSYYTKGFCEGHILKQLRGTGGFGYDPLFYIAEIKKTMAEIDLEEKNKISHRGKALKEAISILRGFL